jgi:DNA repair exonuclease SbcCD ATPase subunit
MEDAAATQARERLTRWIDESREILALIPEVLDSVQKAAVKSEHSERDAERLRKELMELRKELSEAKDKETGGRAQHGELAKQLEEHKKQIEELTRTNETLTAEKEEAAQAFARLLDTVQSTNQIAQKLGVTKSPFARAHKEPASPASPAPHE